MDENKQEEIEIEELTETAPEENKVSFKNKMLLLAVFGILLGFVIKTEAAKRVTVGFEDYKTLSAEKLYDINGLQKGLELQKIAQEEQAKEAEKKKLEEAIQKREDAKTGNTTCDVNAGGECK